MSFAPRVRAIAAAALAVVVGAALVTVAPRAAMALEEGEVVRVAGTDRFATAADAATRAFPGGATDVVLASGRAFPDALAAGGLAGALDAPILLTEPASLPQATVGALEELDPARITIIGGTAAVSDAVADELDELGYDVERVAGADRYATAAEVAAEVGGTTVVLASGRTFADALAISPGAHALGLPILLTDGTTLDTATQAFLDGADVDTVVVVGGTAAVSDGLARDLAEDGRAVSRLAGTDRYETSVAIARFHTTVGFSFDRLLLASGERFPDALAGGPLGSALGAALVLTPGAELGAAAAGLIGDNARDLDEVFVLGGTEAVSPAAADAAGEAAVAGDNLLLLLPGNTVQLAEAASLATIGAPVTFPTDPSPMAAPQLGIAAGTTLVAIDVRPYTGVVYGLGSDGQLYSLNPANGTAVKLGATLAPTGGAIDDVAGFDFNPTVDRLRINFANGTNLRVNPDTGGIAAEDGDLAFAGDDDNAGQTVEVVASAYTDSPLGEPLPATTQLFNLDRTTSSLTLQSPPNDGTQQTVGELGIDIEAAAGFDISPTGEAFAVLDDGEGHGSYAIDLETGAATLLARTDLDVLGVAVFTGTGLGAGEGLLLADDGLTVVALDDPFTATDQFSFAGLNDGTSLLGLDIRGATGMPYAFGSDGQLYVLGAPKTVGMSDPSVIPLEKVGGPNPEVAAALGAGGQLGMDFNPAVDRLRVLVGEVNLRLNPNNGATAATDGPLAYVDGDENEGETPEVTAGAYTDDVRGGVARTTALYDLDSAANVLALQSPPNDGGLVTIGPLGIDLGDVNGFDIARSGVGYVLGADGILPAQLWTVDLGTGELTSVGQLPLTLLLLEVTGLAVR
jgi:putative cell wall-binding protein